MKKTSLSILTIAGACELFVPALAMMSIERDHFFRLTTTPTEERFHDGDIIFQTSRSSQSKAIQLSTHSKYSHMGLLYETNGKYYVYEAVQPVKLTKLDAWINRGEGSHYIVKRLKNSAAVL